MFEAKEEFSKETPPKKLIVIRGKSNQCIWLCLVNTPASEVVPVKIWLRGGFPQYPPYVTIESSPDKKIGQAPYLRDTEIVIPYLTNWNMQALPPFTLVFSMLKLPEIEIFNTTIDQCI